MENMNIQKLNVIHEEMCASIHNETNVESVFKLFEQEICIYSEIISGFFLGRKDDIKKIYSNLKNNLFPYNKISSMKLDVALYDYSNYIKGMIEFIRRTTDLRDTDSVDRNSVRKTVDAVKDKDTDFVESIFDGRLNEVSDMDLDSAMKNVETLIDIELSLSQYVNIGKQIKSSILSNNSDKYKEEILDAIKIYTTSILQFSYKCLIGIFKTYEKIFTSMESRTPAGGVKEVPKYQLF